MAQPSDVLNQGTRLEKEDKKTVTLKTGQLSLEQLEGIFRVIEPEFDFIDDQDIVRWYSNNQNRIFKRESSALNKHVLEVHPKASAGRIKTLLQDMRSGEKEYWTITVPARGKLMNMTFHAVRDESGKYLGCIETTQDVSRFNGKNGIERFKNWLKKRKKDGTV